MIKGKLLSIAEMAELKELFSESDLSIKADIVQRDQITQEFYNPWCI